MGVEETARQMEWCRQRTGGESAGTAIGCHEPEDGLRLEQVSDADSTAEVGEVGAATHADMLTGIEQLSTDDIREGTGSAAGARARLQQRHGETALGQRYGRRQPR